MIEIILLSFILGCSWNKSELGVSALKTFRLERVWPKNLLNLLEDNLIIGVAVKSETVTETVESKY